MFKSGLLFYLMGSLWYIVWQCLCHNSWRTAPGLLQCLQSPAQSSAVLWNVINPVWPILRRVMASCKISIHPCPTLAGFETLLNETLQKREKNETVNLELKLWHKVNKNLIYIHSHFLVWQISGYWAERGSKTSEWTPTCQRKTANTPEEEVESLLVTCAYDRRLIFPVGSHNMVWTHPFWE